MNKIKWSFPVSLLVVAGCAVVVVGMAGVLLQWELEFSRDRMEHSRQEAKEWRGNVRQLQQRVIRLTADMVVQTERANRTEAGLAEERKTTEPLRRQIEKMVQAGIDYENRLEIKAKELKALTDELNAAKEKIGKQDEANRELTKRFQELDGRYQQSVKTEAELRDQLTKTQTQAAELTKQLEESRRNLAKREADYSVLEEKQKKLAAECDGMRKQWEETTAKLKIQSDRAQAAEAKLQELQKPVTPPATPPVVKPAGG